MVHNPQMPPGPYSQNYAKLQAISSGQTQLAYETNKWVSTYQPPNT